MSIEELRQEVNPVYNTAHSCLQLVAAAGDEDSENLRKILGFTRFGEDFKDREVQLPPEILKAMMSVIPVFNALTELRFHSFNNYIQRSGAKTVMDLPSGYTSRGIKLAKSGIKYFGLDLPAVIDAMKPAVKQVIGESENINYFEVDATNYASLRKALEGAEGELHITTEGLLMYFTQSEIETVFGNIRKILAEFGGKWITIDNELYIAQRKATAAATFGLPRELAEEIGNICAGAASKTTLSNNVFFDNDTEKVKDFVSSMGFDLELVSIVDYMPDTIESISTLSDDIRGKVQNPLEEVNFWVMMPKAGITETFGYDEGGFKVDVKRSGDTLKVQIAGRLDTITAPELLALYKEAEAKGKISSICVDMKELQYVSSAGLRVLLIMRKAIEGENDFSLINVSDAVKEIIETTGFDTIFC